MAEGEVCPYCGQLDDGGPCPASQPVAYIVRVECPNCGPAERTYLPPMQPMPMGCVRCGAGCDGDHPGLVIRLRQVYRDDRLPGFN